MSNYIKLKRAVYWMKRDLRLLDNPALTLALQNNDEVVLIYCLEPLYICQPETSSFHINAICNAYNELNHRLKKKESHIYFIDEDIVSTLTKIKKQFDFKHLYANEEVGSKWSYDRDLEVHKWAKKRNIIFHEVPQTGVFRRLKDRDDRAKKWQQFMNSPYLKVPTHLEKITKLSETSTLNILQNPNIECFDFSLSNQQINGLQHVSEFSAHQTLTSFLNVRGINYRGGISSPNFATTRGSRLSVHLAYGTISSRYVYQMTQKKYKESSGRWKSSLTGFLSRIHWRDHFMQRLESDVNLEFQPLHPAYEDLQYENDPLLLEKWTLGLTGFPLVDACMRCLQETGFINFRMRAMITSVACFVLHLDWRLIHIPMAKLYADYEPGIHFSQLQMQAGMAGINTLRVYNPTKQIIDQDPDGVFIKKWVPELRDFSMSEIIGHSTLGPLGDYPPQCVDYKTRVKIMKDIVYKKRKTNEFKDQAHQVYLKHGSRANPR